MNVVKAVYDKFLNLANAKLFFSLDGWMDGLFICVGV